MQPTIKSAAFITFQVLGHLGAQLGRGQRPSFESVHNGGGTTHVAAVGGQGQAQRKILG
jgi:hypothetical protein